MEEVIKKSVIFAGYRCNNNCRFCMESEKRQIPIRTTSEIKREITGARKRGADYLEIIGGEAAIRPDIANIISFARDLGFSTIMMATNGRVFAYPELAEKVVNAGLNSLVFSIHGPDAETHDFLTRTPGSFDQLCVGINNVREAAKKNDTRLHIGSNTCIVKSNFKKLPEIGKLIRSFEIESSEFIFVDCNEGGAANDFNELVPKISEAAPYIRECLEIGKRDNCIHWHIRYVPLCYFPDNLSQISEIMEDKVFHTEHIAQDFLNFDAQESRKNVGRAKTEKCSGCALYDYCEGIWVSYLKHFGDGEFQPVKEMTKEMKIALESCDIIL